jgi:hypothetical protein
MLVDSRRVFTMHFRPTTWSSERNPTISRGASVFLLCACQRPVDSPVSVVLRRFTICSLLNSHFKWDVRNFLNGFFFSARCTVQATHITQLRYTCEHENKHILSVCVCMRGVRNIANNDHYLRHVRPSVCLPASTTRLPLDGFPWNLIFEYFRKFVREKFQVSLKLDKKDWHFTWRPI